MTIYLDNAATSFPKPPAVYDAVDRYNRTLGAAVGRGSYQSAVEVERLVTRCRRRVAEILGAESPERIVFTFNCTDALNLALHGLLRPGDHVVTSVIEHNSMLRPLRMLEQAGVEVTRVPAGAAALIDPDEVRRALRPTTRLVSILHASNVTGTVQPVEEIGRIAREAGAFFLLDAAQTAGTRPIDLRQLPVDLLACAGHKGLLGPLGTGVLYVRPGVESQLRSLRQGGTGTRSEEDRQPESLPDKYESGNHNAPGLVGLEAGLEWLQGETVKRICDHERALTARLREGLSGISVLTVYGLRLGSGDPSYGKGDAGSRVGVVSLNLEGYEPQELAGILDESFGIQARAGLHCAAGAHRVLGTLERGGTVRLSVGPFTTESHVDAAVSALAAIAGAGR